MTSIDTNDTANLHTGAFVPALQPQAFLDPIAIEEERPGDVDARERLLDRAFGPSRFGKTCQRLRAGRLPAHGLALTARVRSGLGAGAQVGSQVDKITGTVRLWHVDAGGVPALMLGPLAVDGDYRCFGIGARLMEAALERAKALGHAAVLLVGDAPYYARFGFERRVTLGLRMPGPVEDARFLGLELVADALADARGLVRPTGAIDLSSRRVASKPRLPRAA